MKMKLIPALILCSLWISPVWAQSDLTPSIHLHAWGPEVDLAWRPLTLIHGTQTTFWLGGEALYQSWLYFHDPVTGQALLAADPAQASVKEISGLWFAGMAQGLAGQLDPLGPGGRPWQTPDLLEVYAYYRGTVYHTLSAGNYLANSSAPDKNGWLETAFLGGIDLNLLTKTDRHNLKQGFLLEGAAETAPRGIQSVAVDYNRTTATLLGFLPIWDLDPASHNNTVSVLGGFAVAWDHLWGSTIPVEALQLIGGRALGGMGGWTQGVGGQVRGPEQGRFDGTDKIVANVEVRVNLPGFETPFLAQDYLGLKVHSLFEGQVIPGLVFFYDYGSWSGLAGIDPGYITTAGAGVFFKFWDLGSVAAYVDDWLSGGSPYQSTPLLYTLSLGMQF
ncbi:MAG: hypothetical protein HKM06_02765 [Spirochaetales bacterium]|nr:hypothetical protein [Spirochaetales bacterium]